MLPAKAAVYCAACSCYHVAALVRVAGGDTLIACPVAGLTSYAAALPPRDPPVIGPRLPRPTRRVGRPPKAR